MHDGFSIRKMLREKKREKQFMMAMIVVLEK